MLEEGGVIHWYGNAGLDLKKKCIRHMQHILLIEWYQEKLSNGGKL
ncbi:hypothetical protein [Paenibacillus borealis]|nr:hypothetical protein [Paenibacillus borealis]